MMEKSPAIFGILNITEDSFSDGGLYLDPADAIRRGEALLAQGADVLDLGPASSHPDAKSVSPEEEMRRLGPLLEAFTARGAAISLDSYHPETQRFAMENGVQYLNDITGFPHPEMYPLLARFPGRLILMHSVQRRGPATRADSASPNILATILDFFAERLDALEAAGVERKKIILDPGMGFFLGTDPRLSTRVLARMDEIKERFSLPVFVSVSRKSFLGELTGRAIPERGAASLAAELFAARLGVDCIRTHEPGALRDALLLEKALEEEREKGR